MNYRERPPRPALSSVIESVWSLSDNTGSLAHAPYRVFPDGCIELVFHFANPFSWKPEGAPPRTQPSAFVVGQLTRPMWLIPGARFQTFGIRFRPWSACGVFGTDLGALIDRIQPLDALWGDGARLIGEEMAQARSDAARQEIIERVIHERMRRGNGAHPFTRWAIQEIVRKRGHVRVDQLAREIGWTKRNLERRFVNELGASPKTLVRTVRFQHLLDTLAASPHEDWAGLAWNCGFSDQAHLIREFRRFTGVTPARLQEKTLELARQFISPERLHRYFSCGESGTA